MGMYRLLGHGTGHGTWDGTRDGTWDWTQDGTRNGTRDGTREKVAFIGDGFHRGLFGSLDNIKIGSLDNIRVVSWGQEPHISTNP